MAKIASISLDIRKNNTVNNDPIVLRQGDSDVIIEASISNNGYPDLGINFATFVAKKPDGTIISNDPVNVNGNTISYPVSKHLTESVGKIQDAYFMINNEVATNGFDISIIPSTQLDDTSVDYIPGIENINKFLESVEADWLGRIQQMKTQIAGLDIPTEFKLLMDKALSDAKAQYQPIIDAAQENVENIVADLAAKKLDLTNNSDQLNQTITAIKAQVASVNSFLDSVQKQIIEANSSFTAGQQAQISQSIADGQKKLADSIASMQSEVAQTITDAKTSIQQIKYNAVGTNLLINTRDDNDVDHPVKMPNANIDTYGLSRTEDYTQITAPPSSYTKEMFYRFCRVDKISMYNLAPGQTYTIQGEVYVSKGDVKLRSQMYNNSKWLDYPGCLSNSLASNTSGFTKVKYTFTIPENATAFYLSWQIYNYDSTTIFRFRRMKLEKGSIATDYSLNPLEIATNDDVTEQIKANQPDLSGFQKQVIFDPTTACYANCPDGTDFGTFLKSNSVPAGFSIIRNGSVFWKIQKVSSDWVSGTARRMDIDLSYRLYINSGQYSGILTGADKMEGKTLKLKDSTGKETTYTITGIS